MGKSSPQVPTQEDLEAIKKGFEAYKKLQEYLDGIVMPIRNLPTPYVFKWEKYCTRCNKFYYGDSHYCSWITWNSNTTKTNIGSDVEVRY